jgi:hypothetical protein
MSTAATWQGCRPTKELHFPDQHACQFPGVRSSYRIIVHELIPSMTTATDQTKLTSNAGEPRASCKGKYVCIREESQTYT